MFDPKLFTQFIYELRREPWISVGDNFGRYAKPREHVVEVQQCHAFCIDGLVTARKMAIFVHPWSVMVRMESYPCDLGNLTIKSIAIVEKGKASGWG